MKVLRLKEGKERSLQRRHPWIFDSAIAKGSGVSVAEVNTLLQQFAQMQQMMKKFSKFQKMFGKMGAGAMPSGSSPHWAGA